jgi:hypothetical protein
VKYLITLCISTTLTLLFFFVAGEPTRFLFSNTSNELHTQQTHAELNTVIQNDLVGFKRWLKEHTSFLEQKADLELVIDYFLWVNQVWEYHPDPIIEVFRGPLESIERSYKGDCDDYAILMTTGLHLFGFRTRIVLTTHHAYPEVFIKEKASIIYKNIKAHFPYHDTLELKIIHEDSGFWLPLDYVAPYPGAMPLLNGEIEGIFEL